MQIPDLKLKELKKVVRFHDVNTYHQAYTHQEYDRKFEEECFGHHQLNNVSDKQLQRLKLILERKRKLEEEQSFNNRVLVVI
ncbi:hypothetical protein HDU92_003664 [Lobulomyces angularis]|nr:hypothetical protein HDU92_003664 [Lobulomyces angularis]